MLNNLPTPEQQAIQACIHDTIFFRLLLGNLLQQPHSSLLSFGLIPFTSLYIVESYNCLGKFFPNFKKMLDPTELELLRTLRHQAKLLDSANESITAIVNKQQDYFLGLHNGLLGPLKRALQPDMGLFLYNGHIIATTHSAVFGSGGKLNFKEDPSILSRAIGEYTGKYVETLFRLFQSHNMFDTQKLPFTIPLQLLEPVEMRDIKHKALYGRGSFGTIGTPSAAGLIILLANLNFASRILPALGPLLISPHRVEDTLFRLKFITLYHANSNINKIQNISVGAGANELSSTTKNQFQEALGNQDSRWLRKHGQSLRNFLTHYLPEEKVNTKLSSNVTRIDIIEGLGKGLPYNEINQLLDRHIAHLSNVLEKGFELSGDPFWYGRVR